MMDKLEIYDKLAKALRNGDIESIFTWLPEIPQEDLRAAIQTTVFADREVCLLTKELLQTQYTLCDLIQCYCNNLKNSHPDVFVTFSASGCTPSSIVRQCNAEASAATLARIYLVTMYLCKSVISRGAEFVLVGLSSAGHRVKLIIHTDVSVFRATDLGKDMVFSMAQNHVGQINGELKEHRVGLDMQLFRLVVTVGEGFITDMRRR